MDLPEGEHQYKFCVDGQWTLDPTGVSKPKLKICMIVELLHLLPLHMPIQHSQCNTFLPQAVMTSKTGTVNNVIQVKTTDFEVFDALRIDSEDSADISGTGTLIHQQHLLFLLMWSCVEKPLHTRPFSDLSSSPPGPYQQEAYVTKSEDKIKHPPILPPHLLQVLLNKDTGISVSTGFGDGLHAHFCDKHHSANISQQHAI